MPNKPYSRHLRTVADLHTTSEAIRKGFVELALEKNRKASPLIDEARSLKISAQVARNPRDLLSIPTIQLALQTAAGLSDKSLNHLNNDDKKEAVLGLIENFLEPAGSQFVEELIFRYLLIKGDALGGAMRNVAGFLAEKKLIKALTGALRLGRIPGQWLRDRTWISLTDEGFEFEARINGISWSKNSKVRTLLFNKKVEFIGKNIDLVLLDADPSNFTDALRSPRTYLALGELKGGIDPAGADEHWKTASAAFVRIERGFRNERKKPSAFFVGAAIERSMASEIWRMLKEGRLTNAANLTNDDQVASVANWLFEL